MRVEKKDNLFEELEDIIKVMNKEGFADNARIVGLKATTKDVGGRVAKSILKKYKKTTLYELSEDQLQEMIDYLHSCVIRGA
jgi:hypothetical protein